MSCTGERLSLPSALFEVQGQLDRFESSERVQGSVVPSTRPGHLMIAILLAAKVQVSHLILLLVVELGYEQDQRSGFSDGEDGVFPKLRFRFCCDLAAHEQKRMRAIEPGCVRWHTLIMTLPVSLWAGGARSLDGLLIGGDFGVVRTADNVS